MPCSNVSNATPMWPRAQPGLPIVSQFQLRRRGGGAPYVEPNNYELVWASGGKLFAARLGKDGLFGEAELHDFSAMRFEAIAAPY